jgi:hypothetical protein
MSCSAAQTPSVRSGDECVFGGASFRFSLVIPEGYHQNQVITKGFRALYLIMRKNVQGMPHYIEARSIPTPNGVNNGLALYRKHGHAYFISENPALSIVATAEFDNPQIQHMVRSHMVKYRYADSGRRIAEFAGEFGREVLVIRLVADSEQEYARGRRAFEEVLGSLRAEERK